LETTEEQYARIKDSLPEQRGNVSLTNLQVLDVDSHSSSGPTRSVNTT